MSIDAREWARKKGGREGAGGGVPPVRPVVEALFVADLHLWHKAPLSRARERCWYAAMERQLAQLGELRRGLHGPAGPGSAALVYCGDIFDRYNPPPELVNWAIKHLPRGLAVPGQHDLPHHRYEDVRKSAYWTLVEAGVLTDLAPGAPQGRGTLRLWGFPWGAEVQPPPRDGFFGTEVAVVHAYCCTARASYPGAPDSAYAAEWRRKLRGYHFAFFGDNHKAFTSSKGDPTVANCGTFLRRKADEADEQPGAWVLHQDGALKRHQFDCKEDVLEGKDKGPLLQMKDKANFEVFLHGLQSLEHAAPDFRAALIRHMDERGVSDGVRRVVLQAMGEG